MAQMTMLFHLEGEPSFLMFYCENMNNYFKRIIDSECVCDDGIKQSYNTLTHNNLMCCFP